ncbi:hypothetical protein E1B28_001443 [Marasmius oreades]|uniref:Uncharacterized protein n=1 Tax=Marasmius oreades TaxID=181124 RepID=A0A9P8AFN3_9AGAR|nr:uncharacterized protein E1B28_001443 [Marasmius oreades]KAG7099615.1 hypothetical protein E1B28_001443 [Marasmius oreades]
MEGQQQVFQKLKTTCVPLLSSSLLTPSSISSVLKLLSELIDVLNSIRSSGVTLNKSIMSYVYFPLSSILKRNSSPGIPDQVLEKIFIALGLICDDWWWDCELETWDQIFMLCGSVIGGIEAKGKGKDRDDETKAAAAHCLLNLLRSRTEDYHGVFTPTQAHQRLEALKRHAISSKFMPIFGQTLNSVLETAESRHLPLQKSSLNLIFVFIHFYLPDDVVVSVLPGVVSTMCKIALGVSQEKGWAKGEITAQSLRVMQEVIITSLADDSCIRDGALVSIDDIESLTELLSEPKPRKQPSRNSFGTSRTSSWLRGTSSQLHIAIKTLVPLVKHPTPSALVALGEFAATVIEATPRTMPATQPLLLSFLLSLSNSEFERVSTTAFKTLLRLFSTDSKTQVSLLHTLMRTTRDNLVALPLVLPSHADAKVEHMAILINTVCRLAVAGSNQAGLRSISTEIGKLLGPSGGIEKWGWSLLSVLEFEDPPVVVTRTSTSQLMLENDTSGFQWTPFPQATLKNVHSPSTYEALVRMFHSLGQAAGDSALSSVEWFANVGQSGEHSRAVAGMWCACRLLEGIAHVDISSGSPLQPQVLSGSKRLDKFVRGLAKSIAQLWNNADSDGATNTSLHDRAQEEGDGDYPVQHLKGLVPLHETLQITNLSAPTKPRTVSQPMLHKSFSLQILSVTAGALQSKFISLLIYTLYPVLHSIVSPLSFLSTTALASLHYITGSTSYASPGNMLLSNFDYVLDSVSRRLSRRWIDIDATKVLVSMIHLVGNDIVERAGDVVEECFDRLDEYHGYEVVVEGIVEVLNEVIKVIEVETDKATKTDDNASEPLKNADKEKMDVFFSWFEKRNDPIFDQDDTTDYGPAPRRAWGEEKKKGKDAGEGIEVQQTTDETVQTAPQALAKQMVTRSMYFLTHRSPVIRARILSLLNASVSVLPADALMPAIHNAWPFILNRLGDPETFIVSAAAELMESLSSHMGSFMYRRIWDDVWPRFYAMLSKLQDADLQSALTRRGVAAVGTESIYTHSHRLYRALLKTMAGALRGVDPQDSSTWEVIVSFRRFLHSKASDELQHLARELYLAAGLRNADAVWLALYSTLGQTDESTAFLRRPEWEIAKNVALIFQQLEE